MKKKILFACSILTACSVLGASLICAEKSKNYDALSTVADFEGQFIPNIEVKDQYLLGDQFTLPEGQIKYNNGSKEVELPVISSYLIYPNEVSKTTKNITFNQIGKYIIVAIAKDGNNKVVATKSFKVFSKAYELSSESSTLEYVEKLPTSDIKNPKAGLLLGLKEGDAFTYNQPININNCLLEGEPIVTFAPHCFSENAGHPYIDASSFIIKLTDVYDSTNYIEVVYTQEDPGNVNGDIRHQYYVRAKTSTSSYTGLELNGGTFALDGNSYKVWTGSKWGASLQDTSHVVTGHDATQSNGDGKGMSLYFDAPSKRLYSSYSKTYIITDFDEPAIYGSSVFKGFTTGDAYLSIRADRYEENISKIDIYQINGRNTEELKDDILLDNDGPVITFDSEINEYDVAKGETIKIPAAHVADLNPKGDLKIEVIYEKGTTNEQLVPISNNCFTPLLSGTYTIVYSAEDAFGNISVREKECFAITTPTNKANNLIVEEIKDVKAGQNVELPAYTLSTLNSGTYLGVKAIYENGEVILPKDNKLFFSKVGNYKIVYEYGDSVSTNYKEYDVEAVANDEYHYISNLALPKYLINTKSFSFENYLVNLVDSKEQKQAVPEIFANFGDGFKKIEDPKKVDVNTSNSVASFQFKYKGKLVKELNDVPVVDPHYGTANFMKNFFVGNVTSTTSTDFGFTYTLTENGNQTVDFINAININGMSLDMKFNEKNFGKMRIVFTDYYNKEYSTFIEIIPLPVGYKVVGTSEITITENSLSLSENSITSSFTVNNDNSFTMPLEFVNGRVNLSFEFFDVTGNTSFDIIKMSNQTFNVSSNDKVAPLLLINDIGGKVSKNKVVDVELPVASDILTPYVVSNLKISVNYYNGETMVPTTSIDGVLLDGTQESGVIYSFIASDFGSYYINYEYVDQSDKKSTNVNVIYVKDDIAPTITIADGYNESTIVKGEYGAEITVKGYSYSDDTSPKEKIATKVYVITPLMVVENITETMKFVATEKGDYKVCYFAKDEEGNICTISYTVRVK